MDERERERLLKSGAFPLTGTVFEVLDALEANKPTWLVLLADRPIDEQHEDVVLNEKRWLLRETESMGGDRLGHWVSTTYAQQTLGVRNFMRALAGRGPQVLTRGPRFESLLKDFILHRVARATNRDRNPYRGLGCYELGDRLLGRERFVQDAVAAIEHAFREHTGPVLRIVGSSGCGKSSALRAGILSAFGERAYRDRYHCLAIHPGDFRDAAGQEMPVIGTLVDLICLRTPLQPPRREAAELRWCGADAPRKAVALINETLRLRHKDDDRLIVGLDQFEEILDAFSTREGAQLWQPLLDFVSEAIGGGRIGFVYTLETTRVSAHADLELGPGFASAVELKLDDQSDTFLRAIIDGAFLRAGYPLAAEITNEIKTKFAQLRRASSEGLQDSALPLLALKLFQLFEAVQAVFPVTAGQARERSVLSSRAEQITRKQLHDRAINLDFDAVISTQAEEAWLEATGEKVDLHALNRFLTPFVGGESERIQLRAANALAFDSPALVESFLRARLLVPAGDAQVRLVHEAVIRHWPVAQRWFSERSHLLAKEADFKAAAERWQRLGRPAPSPAHDHIDQAAEILLAHRQEWATTKAATSEAVLRDYCLEVFRASRTPMRRIDFFQANYGTHVNLAAAYGMTTLLKAFYELDSGCITRANPHVSEGSSPLYIAAMFSCDSVRFLLDRAVDPFLKSPRGWPAIDCAIERNDYPMFQAFIRALTAASSSASLETRLMCPGGYTLLHRCAHYDRRDIAVHLVEVLGFNPDAKADDGWTPLDTASAQGSEAVFKYLETPERLRHRCERNQTPLHLAAVNGRRALVMRMLNGAAGRYLAAARDEHGNTALHHASVADERCVRDLLAVTETLAS